LTRSSIRFRTITKKIFCDTSIVTSCLNLNSTGLKNDLKTFRHLFESLILKDLMVYAEANNGKLFYYDDNSDLEIDAIIEFQDKS
jgi:predicted AAA+ superfamily ATPase